MEYINSKMFTELDDNDLEQIDGGALIGAIAGGIAGFVIGCYVGVVVAVTTSYISKRCGDNAATQKAVGVTSFAATVSLCTTTLALVGTFAPI